MTPGGGNSIAVVQEVNEISTADWRWPHASVPMLKGTLFAREQALRLNAVT